MKATCIPIGIDCSDKEACLTGVLCEHHLAMWRREWFPPHADAVGPDPGLADVNPAKRPRTGQHKGQGSSASASEDDDDEPVEIAPPDQDGISEWALNVYLRTVYSVTNRVLKRGDVFTQVSMARAAATEAARNKRAAKAMLGEERAGRRRHLFLAALKVIEKQDEVATRAIPVMMSVVMTDDLMARVGMALLGQQADGDADDEALIHVVASFGGVPHTVRRTKAGFYAHSVSEFVATTVGPFQLAAKVDLDLIAKETNNVTLGSYTRQEQQRRKGVWE